MSSPVCEANNRPQGDPAGCVVRTRPRRRNPAGFASGKLRSCRTPGRSPLGVRASHTGDGECGRQDAVPTGNGERGAMWAYFVTLRVRSLRKRPVGAATGRPPAAEDHPPVILSAAKNPYPAGRSDRARYSLHNIKRRAHGPVVSVVLFAYLKTYLF